jgi:MFS family permease
MFNLAALMTSNRRNTDDGSLIAGLQALDAWHEDLGNPSSVRIGLLNASGFFAGLVVGPVITYIDDKYGRRWGVRCECSAGRNGITVTHT